MYYAKQISEEKEMIDFSKKSKKLRLVAGIICALIVAAMVIGLLVH